MFATRTMTKTCPYCAEEVQAEAIKCKHCLSWIGDASGAGPNPRETAANGHPSGWFPFLNDRSGKPRRLVRPVHDRKILGVCSGIGHYLGLDPTLIRVAGVIACVCTVGLAAPAYLLMSFAIPNEEDPASIA